MQKLISILVAAMFAGVTLNAVAAADKGKGDEKKVEAKAKSQGAAKKAAAKEKADTKKAAKAMEKAKN